MTLSLQEALQQARANSPTYRQTLNDAGPAKWGVRNAYGSLLPSVNVGSDLGYTGIGPVQLRRRVRPAHLGVRHLGLQPEPPVAARRPGAHRARPSRRRCSGPPTRTSAAPASTLRAEITTQYLTTLQATAQVAVARQQVARNADFLTLAKARYQVGQATLLDVRQAEVTKGQSDVALLRAVQAENEAKLDLLRRMGVEPPVAGRPDRAQRFVPGDGPDLPARLAAGAGRRAESGAPLAPRAADGGLARRPLRQERVPADAVGAGGLERVHPAVHQRELPARARRFGDAQAQAASCQSNNQVRAARRAAEPADCFAAGWAQLARAPALQDPGRASRSATRTTSSPSTTPASRSRPASGSRSRSSPASAARSGCRRRARSEDDADESARARRLQVRSDVHARYLGLQTSYQAIGVQAANREAARDQLRLAQDRYRLGAGTSLEVSDAQNAVQRAEGDYVNAVYDYHKAIAALEAAVGRPLR